LSRTFLKKLKNIFRGRNAAEIEICHRSIAEKRKKTKKKAQKVLDF